MKRNIIFYKGYFIEFYKTLDDGVKTKFQYVFALVKQVKIVPKKFLAPITGYAGLFEIRVEYQSNIYRVFCCFDEGELVILFNGFQKKSQKTPKNEIKKAMKLKDEYFKSKNQKS